MSDQFVDIGEYRLVVFVIQGVESLDVVAG